MDSVLLLLGASIFITNIHYVFLIIAILSAFIPYLIPKFFEGYMDRQRVVNSKASEDYISFVKEGVLGVETIRDYHIEDNFIEDFSKYKNVCKLDCNNNTTLRIYMQEGRKKPRICYERLL